MIDGKQDSSRIATSRPHRSNGREAPEIRRTSENRRGALGPIDVDARKANGPATVAFAPMRGYDPHEKRGCG